MGRWWIGVVCATVRNCIVLEVEEETIRVFAYLGQELPYWSHQIPIPPRRLIHDCGAVRWLNIDIQTDPKRPKPVLLTHPHIQNPRRHNHRHPPRQSKHDTVQCIGWWVPQHLGCQKRCAHWLNGNELGDHLFGWGIWTLPGVCCVGVGQYWCVRVWWEGQVEDTGQFGIAGFLECEEYCCG